ncbi:MAG: alanyl-tRNA editing protein [Pseudomonadota bacterium]
MTESLYVDQPYLQEFEAVVTAVTAGGVVLDRTVFYALGGGQPGDIGGLVTADGREVAVTDTRRVDGHHVHFVAEDHGLGVGDAVTGKLDWDQRHQHMRMHTCLHLLGSLIPAGVTGGNISAAKSRLDFDTDLKLDKVALTEGLNALIEADHPISRRWITAEELEAQPELVRTMSVKPPAAPRVRLLQIADVDLQPCGGTHVDRTGEIGRVRVSKIENKGKHNRRVNIVFD